MNLDATTASKTPPFDLRQVLGLDEPEPEVFKLGNATISPAVFTDAPPEMPPEIIKGVLYEGGKMMLTGASKTGKSMAMLELALSVASGKRWMDTFDVKRGTAIYLNMELNPPIVAKRLHDLRQAMNISLEEIEDRFYAFNLKGIDCMIKDVAQFAVEAVERYKADLVVIDPIYTLLDGSENDPEQVTCFCKRLNQINNAGASVVYVHHHSKGARHYTDSSSRGSGSGIFARDADAILDFSEVDPKQGEPAPAVTVFKLDGTLRAFAAFRPKPISFQYPLHRNESGIDLDKYTARTPQSEGGKARAAQQKAQWVEKKRRFETYINSHPDCTIAEVAAAMGIGMDSLRDSWLPRFGYEAGRGNNGRITKQEIS